MNEHSMSVKNLKKVYKKNDEGYMIDEIDIDLFSNLIESMSKIQIYCDIIILYTSLKDSIEELSTYLQNINYERRFKEYSKANRLTLNMLSSFYSLIEFCNKNIIDFKTCSHCLYDKYFSYRLFYQLRIYMTHKSLGVTSFKITTNRTNLDVKANINIENIIDYKEINKKFREELTKLNRKTVSINDYIDDFDNVINELIFIVFEKDQDFILKNLNFIKENIPNSNNSLSECYIESENKKKHSLYKSISNFVEFFSKGVIYRNKLEFNPSNSLKCYYLFRCVSFLYFNEENVCVKPD